MKVLSFKIMISKALLTDVDGLNWDCDELMSGIGLYRLLDTSELNKNNIINLISSPYQDQGVPIQWALEVINVMRSINPRFTYLLCPVSPSGLGPRPPSS